LKVFNPSEVLRSMYLQKGFNVRAMICRCCEI
jgi:hypothetical protein